MARPLRIEYSGAWYHVMNRGRRKEEIFFCDKDYELFFSILEECSALFTFEIHAYCLMPNHYHLLVHTPDGNLSRAMRHLNGVYTQRINSRHKLEGSLFKGRFKSILIEEESYFLELLRYIHLNPLKAKIADDVLEYRWSSHRAYLKKKECPTWLVTKTALLKFSEHRNTAKRDLDVFVKKEVPRDFEQMMDRIRWPAILGGKQFKEKIRAKIKGKIIDDREVPQHKEIRREYSAEEVASRIIKEFSWDEEVFTAQRIRENAVKKRAFVYVCRKHLHLTCGDIRAVLGNVTFAAVTKYYKQACMDIEKKEGCYKIVKKVNNFLK